MRGGIVRRTHRKRHTYSVAWGAWAVFLAGPLHRDIPVCRWADQLSFDTSQPEGALLKEGTWRQSEAWLRGGSGISGHQRVGRRGPRESCQRVGRETLRRAPEKTSPVFAVLSRGYGVEWSRKRPVLHGNSRSHRHTSVAILCAVCTRINMRMRSSLAHTGGGALARLGRRPASYTHTPTYYYKFTDQK